MHRVIIFSFVFTVLLYGVSKAQENKEACDLEGVIGCSTDPSCEISDSFGGVGAPGFLERLDGKFESTRAEGGRWFLAEYDFDNRGYNVLHFQGHSPLPLGFSLWGFIDLEGEEGTAGEREDISRHFLELDFKRKLLGNAGAIAELNDLEGQNNEIGRFGVFWAPDTSKLELGPAWTAGKFRLGFKFFPVQTISNTGQWSFNWNKQFDEIFGGRVSAGGFFDLNYNTSNNSTIIVTEHQVRYRVAEGLHLITEFRVNEFLFDDFGIAPGIQYRF